MWKHIRSRFNKLLIRGCLGALFCVPAALIAQTNLVVNPNCDSYDTCPYTTGQIDLALGWFQYDWWGTADYFNECATNPPVTIPSYFGYQLPLSGQGYIHSSILSSHKPKSLLFYVDEEIGYIQPRESFGGSLTQSLNPVPHKIEFYVSFVTHGDNDSLGSGVGTVATNAFDLILLGEKQSVYNSVYPYIDLNKVIKVEQSTTVIDDTLNWVKLSACFLPEGGEQYFAIGAFRDTNEIELEFSGISNSNIYTASYYFDNFSIYECDTCCLGEFPYDDHVSVANNPGVSGSPITFTVILNGNSSAALSIYDSAGRLVAANKFSEMYTTYALDSRFAAGIYHYVFESSSGKYDYGKVLVTK